MKKLHHKRNNGKNPACKMKRTRIKAGFSQISDLERDFDATDIFWRIYSHAQRHKYKITSCLTFGLCLVVLFFPEQVLASLENQLDSINTLTTGKIKKYGVSATTIAGGIWALFKGNAKMAGIIVLIGIILGYYLKWIADGMQIG